MDNFRTIEVTSGRSVSTIWLNRPEVRNAFNALMVSELSAVFKELGSDSSARVIVVRGKGKAFCAGADLNWMKEAVNYSREDNYKEALQLSALFHDIYSCPKPVISMVHGASTGGANGIVAASDIAICADDTVFSLSEVKLGLVPAVISPYVIKRVGEFPARELMLTAKRIKGEEAADRGLVNRSCPPLKLEEEVEELVAQLLEGGPSAISITKKLIYDVCNNQSLSTSIEKTAAIIADMRTSEEGLEGMAAFLEKRKTRWAEKS